MPSFVYVLGCRTKDRYLTYVGWTTDVDRRLVEHNTGTDSGPYLYHDQVAFVVIAPEHILGQSSNLAVIGDVHRQSIALTEQTPERQAPPIQVDGAQYHTNGRINQTRRADAYT